MVGFGDRFHGITDEDEEKKRRRRRRGSRTKREALWIPPHQQTIRLRWKRTMDDVDTNYARS
jgi:hypothetical protein